MEIKKVENHKKQFLSLLLLADEQEDMVDKYIDKGVMYVLDDNGIKNIAILPKWQGKGYGRALIDFISAKYREKYSVLQVGTGDSPLTIPFYEKCGFTRSHSIKNFFTDNYNHPIYECDIQLVDMIYLQRKL